MVYTHSFTLSHFRTWSYTVSEISVLVSTALPGPLIGGSVSSVEVKYFTVSGVDLKITVSNVDLVYFCIFSVFWKVGVECRGEF